MIMSSYLFGIKGMVVLECWDKVAGSKYFAECGTEESEDNEAPLWDDGTPEGQPVVRKQLNSEQQRQLKMPGQTQLAEHKIKTGYARLVRLPHTGCLKHTENRFIRRWSDMTSQNHHRVNRQLL